MKSASQLSEQQEPTEAKYLPYHNQYEMKGSLCCKSRPDWMDMPDRAILSNVPDKDLPSNIIRTCKYTIWTFLPLNLIEQFSKMANIYFLIVGYLETLPAVSITDAKPVIWFPLFVVVAISAIKDYFEDRKRQLSDDDENRRVTQIVTEQGIRTTRWMDLRVGDIIRVEQNEYFPADVVVLETYEKGQCYIETKNLDGETNLKIKKRPKILSYLKNLDDNVKHMEKLYIKYEKPNPYLYKFKGSLTLTQGRASEDNQSRSSAIQYDSHHKRVVQLDEVNFILRGCSLRNSQFIYGLVVYSGFDTKIMLNSTKARPKSSHLEIMMNFFIILVFFMQLVVCLFSAQYSAFWQLNNYNDAPYLQITEDIEPNQIILSTLEKWGTWLLIFTNFVPISLLVTLEMVKYLQGIMIHQDRECSSGGIAAEVQTSNLNEELGQVDYMFSDKTGTITKNYMEYRCISINGVSYGDSNEGYQYEDNNRFNADVTNVNFNDSRLFIDLESDERRNEIFNFLMILATCHTIVVDYQNGQKCYNSSSPDELALLMGAKYSGFDYQGTDDDGYMVVQYKEALYKYRLLQVLEFTSLRKKMSVIIQDERGIIKLLCKGADTILTKLLDNNIENMELLQTTLQHLEHYGTRGLRTLMITERQLTQEEYDDWNNKYISAQLLIEDREEAMLQLQAEIEVKLQIVGATGIEDSLQDDVALVMQRILMAGIKIWVLTGDKIETAINISYSCNLLTDNQTKIIIHAESEFEVSAKISQGLDQIKHHYGMQFALIISGDALIHLRHKLVGQLVELTKSCQTVVACRVSPKQKQELVQMIIEHIPNVTTLAVGDGANDVNMITAAHIGIGIKGVEGNQAARSADYALGEFKILQHLLLHHGRECFRRNQTLVGYNFYKNLLIVLPHFWYSFNNGFSPINLYDPWLYQFYNMFYTSMPIVVYAVLDEQYTKHYLIRNPHLYNTTQRLSLTSFFFWFFGGVVQSCVVVYSVFPAIEQTSIDKHGRILFLASVGMVVFCYAIIIANLKIFIFSFTTSMISVFVIIVSILTYLLSYMVLSSFTNTLDISHTFIHLLFSYQFYLVLAMSIALSTLGDLGIWRWQLFADRVQVEPQPKKAISESEQEQQSKDSVRGTITSDDHVRPSHFDNLFPQHTIQDMDDDDESSQFIPTRPRLLKKYTGYAFAQQEKHLDSALMNAQN